MSRLFGFLAVVAFASILPLSGVALAFNPQPDPPGKQALKQQRKGPGGPDAKLLKAPSKGTKVLLPAVQNPREAARRDR